MIRALLSLITVAALSAGCADLSGCRRQADCPSTQTCSPPGASACGIRCFVERLCESSADCSPDQVCADYVANCCFAGELSSSCVPRCTDESCGLGQRCDAISGLCTIVLCNDGYECAAHTQCRIGEAGADAHGCARDTCSSDLDCGDGTCVDGQCYDEPGTCMGPVP